METEIIKQAKSIEVLLENENEWDEELFGHELQSEVWTLIELIKGVAKW